MEQIKNKLMTYLAMDEELSFEEFQAYYNEIMAELQAHYGDYDETNLQEMKYVLSTVAVNASAWAGRKDKNSKKYRKINEKAQFWIDAIDYKLKKEYGYDDEKLAESQQKLDDTMRPDDE